MKLWVKDQTIYSELLHQGLLACCALQHARRARSQPCRGRNL